MTWIVKRIRQEPVLAYSLIQTAVGLGVAFGAPLTATQTGSLVAFLAAVLGFAVRRQVTPIKK